MSKLKAVLVGFFFTGIVWAQVEIPPTMTATARPACDAGRNGRIISLENQTDASDCDNVGGGSATSTCVCQDGTWVAWGTGSGATDKISEGNSSVEVVDAGTGQVDTTVDGVLETRVTSGGLVVGSAAADRADSGALRLTNSAQICWENNPTGTDICTGYEKAIRVIPFPASALKGGMAPDDSFPALTHEEGTNIDIDVLAYDDTTDECAGGTFAVPSDIEPSGTVTFRIRWYSGTATTGDAMFDFRWHEVGDNEAWDGALTTEEAGAVTTAGTVDLITMDTWTETVSTLGWVADDLIEFLLCRDANSTGTGTDNLSGDAAVIDFQIEVPRS